MLNVRFCTTFLCLHVARTDPHSGGLSLCGTCQHWVDSRTTGVWSKWEPREAQLSFLLCLWKPKSDRGLLWKRPGWQDRKVRTGHGLPGGGICWSPKEKIATNSENGNGRWPKKNSLCFQVYNLCPVALKSCLEAHAASGLCVGHACEDTGLMQ